MAFELLEEPLAAVDYRSDYVGGDLKEILPKSCLDVALSLLSLCFFEFRFCVAPTCFA